MDGSGVGGGWNNTYVAIELGNQYCKHCQLKEKYYTPEIKISVNSNLSLLI